MTQARTERRGAPRIAADYPVRLSDATSATGAQSARLQDISSSGLCCLFPEPVTEMTVVSIDLELPSGAQTVRGVVVRCAKRRGVSPPTYEVAVYFADLEPAARSAIEKFAGS